MKYQSKIYARAFLGAYEKKSAPETVRRFLGLVRKNGDFSKLPKILYDFKKLYNKNHGIKEVKVEIAREDKSIINQVKEILKLKQEPEVEIKKEILGGVIVSIDDEVIVDGSIKSRIDNMFRN
ncbi:MAG: hypothetical protein A3G49_06400 [Candidatus Sungbacteria bacterium RIFCSPLOWO2_12_FULL_41_11]|uniref:Uncharacterized protein n=1 Tax=Candidatus Sungbacteria bacterium RIFCSPLOWO2_12_FULL_41_11 TaxID=1802286 RepID=A0A1G2LUG6_9BACT|nr:MAG: hypothetical protein UV01_C0003G0058 [Parcubacteria group bacterium GW2011_GWA2_42_14]OHA14451.1 MAG: hypothetical protein A3G49_06400 [Candidatus Sungbacteria bacterium RIFCSPLOWO2_12_FULL_41_11]